MSVESVLKFGTGNVNLNPAPINPAWILEGTPVARNQVLSSSTDGNATTFIWDCTAGRFNWHYSVDETVYVIEGSVIVKDQSGVSRRVSAGETIFFPAGTVVEWKVEKYIRKVAFCLVPMPRTIRLAKRGYRFLKRLVGGGEPRDPAAAMFQAS
jgi:uncharacterized cupin superfamily protein